MKIKMCNLMFSFLSFFPSFLLPSFFLNIYFFLPFFPILFIYLLLLLFLIYFLLSFVFFFFFYSSSFPSFILFIIDLTLCLSCTGISDVYHKWGAWSVNSKVASCSVGNFFFKSLELLIDITCYQKHKLNQTQPWIKFQ
jgi:hypothetical protein